MLVKCLAACTHLSSTVFEIYRVIGRKLWYFQTPPLFSGPAGPAEFHEDLSTQKKLEWMGYRVVKKSWQYVQPFWCRASVWQTDRQTDGQTDVQPISITCFSIADARKNHLKSDSSDCWAFGMECTRASQSLMVIDNSIDDTSGDVGDPEKSIQ